MAMALDRETRTVRVELRLTQAESRLLDEMAERFGKTRSGFLRLALHAIALYPTDEAAGEDPILFLDATTWQGILSELRRNRIGLGWCNRLCEEIEWNVKRHTKDMLRDAEIADMVVNQMEDAKNAIREMVGIMNSIDKRICEALSLRQLIRSKVDYDRGWAENRQKARRA